MKKDIKSNQPENNIAKVHSIRMRLLARRSDFKNLVKQIREHLNLPQQGLSFEGDRGEEYDGWHKRFTEEGEEGTKKANALEQKSWENYQKQIQLHKKFQDAEKKLMTLTAENTHRPKNLWDSENWQKKEKELEKLKSQLKSDTLEPEFRWQERKRILLTIPENYLNEQIDNIIYKYNLPAFYQEIIRWYILYDKIKVPTKNFLITRKTSAIPRRISPEEITNGKGQSRYISIDIFAPLTNKEVNSLIKRLRQEQKEYFPPGLLVKIRPQTKIEELLELSTASETAKKSKGQPKKKEEYLINSGYLQRLEKAGLSEKEIRKIAQAQKLAGKRLNNKKQKIEKTSGDIAKERLGSYKKSANVRKARLKLKKMDKKIFPLE